VGESLPLQEGEKPIAWHWKQWLTTWDKISIWRKTPIIVVGKAWLVVTNQRILQVEGRFIHPFEVRSWKDDSFNQNGSRTLSGCQVTAAYSLEDISSVHETHGKNVAGALVGTLHIQMKSADSLSISANPGVLSLVPIINEAMVKRKSLLQRQQAKNVVIDFSWVKEYLNKGGIVLTTIKCPQCGASIDLPKEGSTTKCGYCRASIHAQDVLERFTGLIKS